MTLLAWAINDVFDTIGSIVLVEFDGRGMVVRRNAGLRRIIADTSLSIWQLINQPLPDTILNAPPDAMKRIYAGPLTVRGRNEAMITLTATIYRENDRILLVGGYDMDEFEILARSLLEINEMANNAQRDLARANRVLESREHTIREMSLTDALTGVGNRRRLDEMLLAETARADRYGEPLSLIILDIDHFKQVNDNWGHETGDRVLREMGGVLLNMLRQTDIATRMGGEEFVVLLPATNLRDAAACAERFRGALARRSFGLPEPVTSSFGVACHRFAESGASLLARADTALYAAKKQGRNRVVAAEPERGV